MIDLIYLAHGRPEFTTESWAELCDNTNWTLVSDILIYTDGYDNPELYEWVFEMTRSSNCFKLRAVIDCNAYGGPVEIMRQHFRRQSSSAIFAKIDNDVIVPPGWLDQALGVMEACPSLDLLGLEPWQSRTPAPWAPGSAVPAPDRPVIAWYGYAPCDAIGGVGLMRYAAFDGRPEMQAHSLYGGFTDWQLQNPEVTKGWIVPPLKLFLLDRLPIEPWRSLSAKYIERGQQRAWTPYPETSSDLWDWWAK